MKNRLLLMLLPLCLACNLHAQSIVSLLEDYDAKAPQEKIHIHFDNSYYAPGQTVFFKAYLLKGTELSDLSKDLYVNWFDEEGNIINRTIAPADGYTWTGSFTIPATYTGRQLNILAHTRWMLNFDSAFLFRRSLGVIQAADTSKRKIIPRSSSIRFFPEGGDPVENISSVVAFKVIDQAGLPAKATGIVTNENKETIARFSSEHDGMGKFTYKPVPGKSYTAEWKDDQGTVHYKDLPPAKKTGIVLSVTNENNTPSFSVERSPEPVEERFKKLSFVATINQKVVLYAGVDLNYTNKITAKLDVSSYPSGILQLTVLDADGAAAAERILFINNDKHLLPVAVSTDTINLSQRAKNTFTIELSDMVQTSLSLSVTDGDGDTDTANNILSQLLLSSDIRGYVHNPTYYFSGQVTAQHDLDLVMLTNGWRRFKWEEVLNGKPPVVHYPHDTGYLKKTAQLSGKKKVIISTSLLPFDNKIKTAFPVYHTDPTSTSYNLAIAMEQQKLEALMKKATLKEVVVRSTIKSRLDEMDDWYTSGSFKGDGVQLNVSDDAVSGGFQNVLSYLQNRAPVAGLTFSMTNPPDVSWRSGGRKNDALTAFFLDQVQMLPIDIMAISMADVAYIKIFRPPFEMARLGGPGGAIAVYTKKGGDSKPSSAGVTYLVSEGYSPVKEFYSPDYGQQSPAAFSKDLRRTLYWQPDIRTDGVNKKVIIHFYNNDISHSLRLVLEGIAADGRMIHLSKVLQ